MQVPTMDTTPYSSQVDFAALPSLQAETPVVTVAQSLLSSEPAKPGASQELLLGPRLLQVSKDNDFPEIQAIVQQTLVQQVQPSALIAPPITPTTPYEYALENLRRHLYSLGNPYLVKTICEKLNLLTEALDLSSEESLMSSFSESPIPEETKVYLRAFSATIVSRATNELGSFEKTYQAIKSEIAELSEKLSAYNNKILTDYKKWKLFKILFKIPGFGMLKDLDFRKLMKWIDLEASEQLMEEVNGLFVIKALEKDQVEKDLEALCTEYNLDEDYDLDTLLSQVIDTRPKKKNGLLTYWNYPKEFFINKTLYLNDPQGTTHTSSIVDCKLFTLNNGQEKMAVYMQDKSELHLVKSPTLKLILIKHNVHKLWAGIQNHSLVDGDRIIVEHSSESNHHFSIQQGEYVITDLKIGTYFLKKYLSFKLKLPSDQTRYYLLTGYYKEEKILSLTIKNCDRFSKNFEREENECLQAFESSHRFFKKEIIPFPEIKLENIEDLVIIKEDFDEDKTRLRLLEDIKKQLNEIINQLKNDRETLNELIDCLVKNKLNYVDYEILNNLNPTIAKGIKDLSQRHYDDLKSDRTPREILKQVVMEANYSILVDKQDTILIARTMELLRAAKVHVDNIKNHDLILFMGNTGSGKSTSISYLMNANFEEVANHVGDKVVKIKKNLTSQTNYPKIGQSIGTSETIYTQGFLMEGVDYMLGDCPGFNDTRGGDYELCTNFSIDQAVNAAKNIRSLVIVIPAAAFVLDKGNSAIELITNVKNKFIGTFDPNFSEKNKRVYLLVTKQNQVQPEVFKNLKHGNRFLEFVTDIKSQIKELKAKYEADSIAVVSIKNREEIWNAIYKMYLNGQVHFVGTKDKVARKMLLNCYASSNEFLDKKTYLPAMTTPYMQNKFGGCVKMSAHSWAHHILGKFLTIVPGEIATLEQEIQASENILAATAMEKQQKEQDLQKSVNDIAQLESHIQYLSKDQNSLSEESLNEELVRANQLIGVQLDEEQLRFQETAERLDIKKSKLSKIYQAIKAKKSTVNYTMNSIVSLKKTIKELKTKEIIEELFKYKINHNFIAITRTFKSKEAPTEALNELCLKDEHFEGSVEFNTQTYTGTTINVVIINKGYCLVPSDPSQREQFFLSGQGGGYIAKVDGLRYRLGLGKAQPDGKKIGYLLELDWQANEQWPWVTITCTIPGKEYNHATIVDKKSEINLLEERLKNTLKALKGDDRIPGLKIIKNDLEQEVQNLENEKNQSIKKIEELKEDKKNTLARIADLLQREKNELASLKEKIPVLEEEVQQLEAKIQRNHLTIAAQKSLKSVCENNLRNLAIIIATQWENGVQLREFASYVVALASGSDQAKSETVKSCEEFIEIFDKNKGNLLQEIKEKYGF